MRAQMGAVSNRLFYDALGPQGEYRQPPDGHGPMFYEEWRRLVDDFPPEYFREADIPIMEQYINAVVQLKGITEMLRVQGPLVDTSYGPKTNPLLTAQGSLRKQMMALARMVRVGPSTRAAASQVPASPDRKPGRPKNGAGSSVVPIAGSR